MLFKLRAYKHYLFIVLALVMMGGSTPASAQGSMTAENHGEVRMFTTVRILKNNAPLPKADVAFANQSRTTDQQGFATFEDIHTGQYPVKVYYNGITYDNSIKVQNAPLTIDVSKNGPFSLDSGLMMLSILIAAALIIALAIYNNNQAKRASIQPQTSTRKLAFGALVFVLVLAFIITIATYQNNIIAALFNANNANQSLAAELDTIPKPTNVKIYGDDRVATVTWTPVSGSNVVGYVVKWGKESIGSFTDMKQTIHPITQIQPLENGVKYIVQVQSVQGSYTYKPTSSEQGGNDKFATANGNVSLPVVASVIPTSQRVDSMRKRLTGFFDDMNISAGGFDETKWNHAVNACVAVGEDGQFINSQLHGHNMTASGFCDRGGTVSRARGVFDITGRTEADPGVIEFDIDGVSQPRDVWYIDLIPTDARKNGIPVDVTSHNDLFDADSADPGRMIRIAQLQNGTASLNFHYFGVTNQPGSFGSANLNVNMATKTPGYEFMSPVNFPVDTVIPNVRRHWRIEYSPTKLKVYIDAVKVGEGTVPSLFATIKKYHVHSTLFSYNTGKQFDTVGPTTSMLHWDNFGFNGPAPTLVTHNYLDGGPTGTTPLLARGTKSAPIPTGNRTTKIPIPDPIGTPVGKVRLMYTAQPFGYSYYYWNVNNSITVNGKKYSVPDPQQNIQTSVSKDNVSMTNIPHATGIYIEPADIKQGMNEISFNLNTDILNVHLEVDYENNNAPNYTQPKDVFANFTGYVTPPMNANDAYWFVEQKMGLENLANPGASLPPTPSTTPAASGTPQATQTPSPSPSRTPSPIPATDTPAPIVASTPTPSPLSSSSTGSVLTIYAAGTPARGIYPTLVLNINNNGTRTNVATFTNVNGNPNSGQFNTFTYKSNTELVPGQIRVRFTNDYYNPQTGEDRNVRINKISIDGQEYLSSTPSVYSTGTWAASNGCAAGYKQSDWLMCNGYFQYK